MQNSSLLLVIPLSAVLAGAAAGFVQHLLGAPTVAGGQPAPSALTATNSGRAPSLEPVLERLDRLIQRMDLERPSRVETARVDAASPPSLDLAPLEELLERIEKVERRMASRVVSTSANAAAVNLPGRERHNDWTSIEPLFQGDLEQNQGVALDRYQFASLAEVLQEFGRPTYVSRQKDGRLKMTYYKEDGRRMTIYLNDGYVINVTLYREN